MTIYIGSRNFRKQNQELCGRNGRYVQGEFWHILIYAVEQHTIYIFGDWILHTNRINGMTGCAMRLAQIKCRLYRMVIEKA